MSSMSSAERAVSSGKPFAIFLDIDGVLTKSNGELIHQRVRELFPYHLEKAHTSRECDIAASQLFDKVALENLDQLIKEMEKTMQVMVVISSAWRVGYNTKELQALFQKHLFSKYIVDKTADCLTEIEQKEAACPGHNSPIVSCRSSEIRNWLLKHPEVKNYVILDDVDNHLSTFGEKFAKVDAAQLLTNKIVRVILEQHNKLVAPVVAAAASASATAKEEASKDQSAADAAAAAAAAAASASPAAKEQASKKTGEDVSPLPSLKKEFASLMRNYNTALETTEGCGARAQGYVDAAYAKLTQFASAHAEFKNQLPKKHNCSDDGLLG